MEVPFEGVERRGEAHARREGADRGVDQGIDGRETRMRRSHWVARPNRGDLYVCHDRAVRRYGDSLFPH